MILYLAGTEFKNYRALLDREGHHDVALSYTGLRKRKKLDKPLHLDEQFSDRSNILIDSGTSTIGSKPGETISQDDIIAMADQYYTNLVVPNLARIDHFVEFDTPYVGDECKAARLPWLKEHRDKAIVVWHPGQDLTELCETWPNVAVPKDALDTHLVQRLGRIVRETGVHLFGLGITKPDLMERVPFHAVTSTSWLSPSQYGDTIWFSGGQLRRYPVKMKDRARSRHNAEFAAAGFDTSLIEADDSTEVLRLSIYAWDHYMQNLNAQSRGVSDPSETPNQANADRDLQPVDTRAPEARHDGVTTVAVWEQNEPIRIRTRDQLADAEAAVLELEFERLRRRAQAEAKYPDGELDPVLSEEIDRWSKLVTSKRKADETSVSISIKASQKGEAQTGLISRLFGREEDNPPKALPAPRSDEQRDVVDAEIIGEEAA
ncbi:hypothetical protein AB0H73_05815 [Streptomyces olivoreticuli]